MGQAEDTSLLGALRAWLAAERTTTDAAVAAKLDALSKRVAALETAPAPSPQPGPAPVPGPTPAPTRSPLADTFEQKTLAALDRLEKGAAASADEFTFYTSPPNDRHYYDTPFALGRMYQRTEPATIAKRYHDAMTRESALYRASLAWSADRRYAWPKLAQAVWTPTTLLDVGALRRMYVQGQVLEWQLDGVPAAREAALALANTIQASLPMLSVAGTKPPILERTERNLAFALMGLASASTIDAAPYATSVKKLTERAIAWNQRSPSGGFEHDLAIHDAAECENGWGGSPFMTALLSEALALYWRNVTKDARIPTVLQRASVWIGANRTDDRRSYQYLVGCQSSAEYHTDWKEDLNALVVGTHAWSAMLGGKLVDADMAQIAMDTYWARKSPKHFAQDVRGMLPFVEAQEGKKL